MTVRARRERRYFDDALALRISECVDMGDGCFVHPEPEHTGYTRVHFYSDELGRWTSTGLHRAVWEAENGPIPEGLVIDHTCENKACIHLPHLEVVTQKVNVERFQYRNNRRLRTHCPQGHEYDEKNTYVDRRGHRQCRTCVRRRNREWREKRRTA